MVLGLFGVIGFSATLPATRIAVHYLDPTIVGLGRSVVAAVLAAVLLGVTRPRVPSRDQVKSLMVVAAGVIVGFPLLSAWAMQQVPAAHAAIVVAILPLFTAIAGALRMQQRPARGFWVASVAGSACVIAFVLFTAHVGMQRADGLLVIAALLGAIGYAEGGRLARALGGWQVICWALVITAPLLLLPVAFAIHRHGMAAPLEAWLAFGYVSVVSQLLAFFLWYEGMAMGGVVRVSQVQLLQVFLTMAVSAALLGETITPLMLVFAALVVSLVAVSRRMPIIDAAGAPQAVDRNAFASVLERKV
ncbi:MAG: DMT family transporter [Gammaproteobacteria bacterium]